ncbi:MAG: hypothetical protein R6U96_10330, partial [Promethearchaeia archaeon]
MERNLTHTRKRQLAFLCIGVLALQFVVFGLLLNNENAMTTIDNGNENNDNDDLGKNEEILSGEGTLPNITREDAPLILKNESNPDLWAKLHGLSVENIRIAYFTEGNDWELAPFQLDEKGYLRTFKYEMAYAADVSTSWTLGSLDDLALNSWGHYEVRHGYVGRHIDATPGDAREDQQLTKTEAEQSIYDYRENETYFEDPYPEPSEEEEWNSTIHSEDDPPKLEQLNYRIDYDDELVFPAKNGKTVGEHSWWNYEEFPNRYRVEITDPVDGGQSWLYIYYNEEDTSRDPESGKFTTNAPEKSSYIPPGEKSYVDWDKENLQITADTYELGFDPDNLNLQESLRIKESGLAPNDLLTTKDKQYFSIWFHAYMSESGATLDVTDSTEVWRDGEWYEGTYNDQYSALGYGIAMDHSWEDATSGERTAHPDDYNDGNDPVTQGLCTEEETNTVQDDGDDTGGIDPDQDQDGNTAEDLPFVRGWFYNASREIERDGTGNINNLNRDDYLVPRHDLTAPQGYTGTHEAAIDGPVRTILDRFTVQMINLDVGDQIGYAELWTTETETYKFYGDMLEHDPMQLNLTEIAGDDDLITLYPHYAFIFGERYSDFVRQDAEAGNAFTALGRAPSNVPGIKEDYQQCDDEGKTKWTNDYANNYETNSLILTPDGQGGDDVSSPTVGSWDDDYYNNPSEGHYDDSTPLVPDNASNPLSDWKYLHTSSGGMWSYVPYQEWWAMFQQDGGYLSTYWADEADYSELSVFGHRGDTMGSTEEFERRYVFGNFTYWESLREYARMKDDINENVEYVEEEWPGGVIFEDSSVYVNDELQSETAYLKNGDEVNILVDLYYNESLTKDLFTVDTSSFNSNNDSKVEVFDESRDIWNISFTVDSDEPDRVPPSSGYAVNITVEVDPEGSYIEELYLDNDPPNPPDTFNGEQPAGVAQVDLNWSGASDNGKLDYYVIYRNGQPVKTLDAPASEWTDTDVTDGETYTYSIRVYDMAGNYKESTKQPEVTIDLDFTPATPAPLDPYFNDTVTLDWSENPGNTTIIDYYRVHWAKDSEGPWDSLEWLAGDETTYEFDPMAHDTSPENGTYYLKLESYNDDEGMGLFSGSESSFYDTETPIPGAITDIPDEYYPSTAEIYVDWGGHFDAFAGIDYFELYRSENSNAPEDYEKIATRPEDKSYYYDTDLTNETTYRYFVRVYDKAGNFDETSVEKVTYYDTYVDAEPNLKVDTIEISKEEAQRGSDYPFDVNVTVNNIGKAEGDVSSIWLKFQHPTYGNVTDQYNVTDPDPNVPKTVPAEDSVTFTFTDCYAYEYAYEGSITVDAAIRGDTNDTNADTTDSILIEDVVIPNFISAEVSPDPLESGNELTIETEIDDKGVNVKTVTAAIFTPGDEKLGEIELIESDGVWNGTWDSSATDPNEDYYTNITASNEQEQTNTTTVFFDIVEEDTEPPEVSITDADTSAEYETGSISVNATVTDNRELDTVNITFYEPDATLIGTYEMDNSSGGTFTYTWDVGTYAPAEDYNFTIIAEDVSGNVNDTEGDTFAIEDTVPPEVTDIVAEESVEYGTELNVNATVTDTHELDTVNITFYEPDA